MKARELTGRVFCVRTQIGTSFLLETEESASEEETRKAVAEFCASKFVKGYIITSVVELCRHTKATPKYPVLTSKEYKDEVKRLLAEGKANT